MVDAFIFDMDGTLVDTEFLWCGVTTAYLTGHGHCVTHEEVLALVYGRAWSDIRREMIRRFPDLASRSEGIVDELTAMFNTRLATADVLIEGSITLLKTLAGRFPVCVVSGSTRAQIETILDLTGIGCCLRFFLGSEDYHPGKPDPACFLLAAQRLGVPPDRCLVFEDSAAGVRAAHAAGMRCVALQRHAHYPQDFSLADATLADLAEFDLAQFGIPADGVPA